MSASAKRPKDCPCRTGRRYAECCGPLHSGARDAATPEELMRSRFSAFALGLGPYLVRTLSRDHEDRAVPEPDLARALSRAKDTQRFLDLCIMHTSSDGDHGEVLFFAKVFERGADRSFAELSSFAREDGAWRYASGVTVATDALPADPTTLTREDVLRGSRA